MKNAMFQVRAQKKAGSKLLWNLPPSFMGDDYLTSMFFVVLDEKCDVSGKGTKKGRFQIALESASIIYGR